MYICAPSKGHSYVHVSSRHITRNLKIEGKKETCKSVENRGVRRRDVELPTGLLREVSRGLTGTSGVSSETSAPPSIFQTHIHVFTYPRGIISKRD